MLKKYAVIGHPIGHTMSPFIHKRLFSLQGIEVEYSAIDIAPENLKDAVSGSLLELNGFNVTIPHKELIMPFMDDIDASAKKYNAVNCVKVESGKLYSCSTDAFGFTEALKANGVQLKGNVLVLGSGGAARTLAREAADNGCNVTIAVRLSDLQKAAELKDWLIENGGKATVARIETIHGDFDLLINATPVGMYPNVDERPVDLSLFPLLEGVIDVVYNPLNTVFSEFYIDNELRIVDNSTTYPFVVTIKDLVSFNLTNINIGYNFVGAYSAEYDNDGNIIQFIPVSTSDWDYTAQNNEYYIRRSNKIYFFW